MGIKMIAVDMDGTFLNNQQEYDRVLFEKLYRKMQGKGIEFVVASGNQYYQLKSFFKEIAQEINFVSENGAYIISHGIELYHADMSLALVKRAVEKIKENPEIKIFLCGKNSAYVEKSESDDFKQHIARYYHHLTEVTDLTAVENDTFLKFALNCSPSKTVFILEQLTDFFKGELIPVSSGHGDMDLILPGVHKAAGLMRLQKKFAIETKEIVAFGDGGNDIEMLKHAGKSYAMENAPRYVKKAAKAVAPSNQNNGVQLTIEKLIEELEM